MNIKICGLKTPETVAAAVAAGASHIGFNFFAPSPRAVTPGEAGRLARDIPRSRVKTGGVKIVALVVDAEDGLIDAIQAALHPDIFQLHGSETPERVREVAARTGAGVIKAVRIADAEDVRAAGTYDGIADMLLFDAKPPRHPDMLPGGNGLAFDWTALAVWQGRTPWMLAGGLHAGNVADAIRRTGAAGVDTASGVEDAPGVKNAEKIAAFAAAARAARPQAEG